MREVSRDEQDVLTRLGVRYRNFSEIEQDLAELDGLRLERRRREYLEREQPAVDRPAEPSAPTALEQLSTGKMWPALGLVGAMTALIVGGVIFFGLHQSAPAATILAATVPTATAAPPPPPRASTVSKPISTAAPAGAPATQAATVASLWTPALCSWADQTLQEDVQLDQQTAAQLRAGNADPRFPGATADSFTTAASHWQAIDELVLGNCGQAPGSDVTISCATAGGWLDAGAQSHLADEQRAGITAADLQWDQQWAAFYQQLKGDLAQECVSPLG